MTSRSTVPQRRANLDGTAWVRQRPLTPAASWPVLLLGSVALAVVSMLVLPRGIAYDPWSWLVWGREIAHLNLDTRTAATAVKPLPIFINTLFAPTGSLAPTLWMLTARAATLLSVAITFRLGARLGGVGAGLVAALGLAVSNEFLGYLLMQGMSEPMAAAAVLAAVDNHIEGRRRWALASLILAGLLRPEAWPFLFAYCLLLAYHRSMGRKVVAVAVAVAVPLSWFVIDWFGSRQFLRSAGAATHQSQGGPLLSREPGLATLRETWHLMSAPFLILFVLGFGAALVAWWRDGRPTPSLWLGLGALGWLAVDALLAQGRFATGAPRYLLPGVALACVVGGVFFADVVRALASRPRSSRAAVVVTVTACVALLAVLAPRLENTRRQIDSGVHDGRVSARLAASLPRAVALAGGRGVVAHCGQISTQPYQVPFVAWQLRVPIEAVADVAGPAGTVLAQGGLPKLDAGQNYRRLGTVGPPGVRWTVLSTCR